MVLSQCHACLLNPQPFIKFIALVNVYLQHNTMFSLASNLTRRAAPMARHQLTLRAGFAQSVKEGLTATDAWTKSCYSEIDYTVNDDASVYEAVQKFAAYNIGASS
jgi:hypothetical protein